MSPYQNHELLAETAERMGREYGVRFLYRDFRPLWQAGIDRSKEMGLYRQNYCACIFSEYERFEKKLRKLSAE